MGILKDRFALESLTVCLQIAMPRLQTGLFKSERREIVDAVYFQIPLPQERVEYRKQGTLLLPRRTNTQTRGVASKLAWKDKVEQ